MINCCGLELKVKVGAEATLNRNFTFNTSSEKLYTYAELTKQTFYSTVYLLYGTVNC